jgi:hypothetical protein
MRLIKKENIISKQYNENANSLKYGSGEAVTFELMRTNNRLFHTAPVSPSKTRQT